MTLGHAIRPLVKLRPKTILLLSVKLRRFVCMLGKLEMYPNVSLTASFRFLYASSFLIKVPTKLLLLSLSFWTEYDVVSGNDNVIALGDQWDDAIMHNN